MMSDGCVNKKFLANTLTTNIVIRLIAAACVLEFLCPLVAKNEFIKSALNLLLLNAYSLNE